MKFNDYVIDHPVDGLKFKIKDNLSKSWYGVAKDYVLLEFSHVINNIKLEGQNIIDGGCHHGYYTLLFAKYGKNVTAIEPNYYHIGVAKENLALNNLPTKFIYGALWSSDGKIGFNGGSRVGKFDTLVPSYTLETIDPNVNVVKLDIEGSEYEALPHSIDRLPLVHSWIIELHGDQRSVVQMLIDRNYTISWIDRKALKVREFSEDLFKTRTTIFAVRDI